MLVPCQEFLIFYHSDSFKINLYNTDAHMEPEGVLYSHQQMCLMLKNNIVILNATVYNQAYPRKFIATLQSLDIKLFRG